MRFRADICTSLLFIIVIVIIAVLSFRSMSVRVERKRVFPDNFKCRLKYA